MRILLLDFFITFLFIKKGRNRILINGRTFALVSQESYAQIENSGVLNETFLVLEQVHCNPDIIKELNKIGTIRPAFN